jgi:hypothetical protein
MSEQRSELKYLVYEKGEVVRPVGGLEREDIVGLGGMSGFEMRRGLRGWCEVVVGRGVVGNCEESYVMGDSLLYGRAFRSLCTRLVLKVLLSILEVSEFP